MAARARRVATLRQALMNETRATDWLVAEREKERAAREAELAALNAELQRLDRTREARARAAAAAAARTKAEAARARVDDRRDAESERRLLEMERDAQRLLREQALQTEARLSREMAAAKEALLGRQRELDSLQRSVLLLGPEKLRLEGLLQEARLRASLAEQNQVSFFSYGLLSSSLSSSSAFKSP